MYFLQWKRREFITLLGAAAAWPLAARAQQGDRIRKIGLLIGTAESDQEAGRRIAAFAQALRELGWIEGQSVTFMVRYADANPERLPALAAEIVAANVNVIVTYAAQSIEAARKATSTIPIVMATVGDALGAGYIASLARPGGNITGLTLVATDQSAKRLQLIKEISPGPGPRCRALERERLRPSPTIQGNGASGSRHGDRDAESLPIHSADEIDAALQSAIQANAQAIVTMDDPLVQSQRVRIVEFAMRRHLPLMSEHRPIPEAGGLMSYGPNQIHMWRRAAAYVDKIFQGAKPADLPVEQPTKFELVVNLKTARALGIEIPTSNSAARRRTD